MNNVKTISLKVCGMRNRENIMNVAALHPDYMGFIFYEKSPRYVGDDFVLPDEFPGDIRKVGVFVNESRDKIIATARRMKLDYLQLHGNESVGEVAALKEAGFGIIKVFPVGEEIDFSVLKPYQLYADFFLFDTKGKFYGGNAMRFDWNLLKGYNLPVQFFLGGGLSPDNVGDVRDLSNINIHGLDINSGVEIRPGFKDVDRIKTVKEILKRN